MTYRFAFSSKMGILLSILRPTSNLPSLVIGTSHAHHFYDILFLIQLHTSPGNLDVNTLIICRMITAKVWPRSARMKTGIRPPSAFRAISLWWQKLRHGKADQYSARIIQARCTMDPAELVAHNYYRNVLVLNLAVAGCETSSVRNQGRLDCHGRGKDNVSGTGTTVLLATPTIPLSKLKRYPGHPMPYFSGITAQGFITECTMSSSRPIIYRRARA